MVDLSELNEDLQEELPDLGSKEKSIDLIKKLSAIKAAEADKVALWKEIEQEFGGRRQFVREMKMLYDDCPEGSANKVRMGSIFLEIFAQAAAQTVTSEPELGFSTEELGAALAEINRNGFDFSTKPDGS